MAGLDFKSSGVHRKVGSVGSIPMHLRHFCFQREKAKTGSVVLELSLLQKDRPRFSSENSTENADVETGVDSPETP